MMMFRSTVGACLSLMLVGAAALGSNILDEPKASRSGAADAASLDPWAGTYQDAQVTLELKANPAGGYGGMLRSQDRKYPVAARADGDQLIGAFQSSGGNFGFTATADGNTLKFITGGKTYRLQKQGVNPLGDSSSAANPLAAGASPAGPGPATGARGGAPVGYEVVVATDAGKKLVAHKAEAKSVPIALTTTLQDLARWFDGRPVAKGAFTDAKEHRRGGAPFTAKLNGQSVKGVILCDTGDQGADIAVTYCRADASASEWAKLSGGADASLGAAAPANSIKTETYAFPDGTGTIQLPAGWKTSARTAIQAIVVEGPAGQFVTLGQSSSVNTPDSFIVQNQIKLAANARQMGFPPPKPIEMLVAPYTGPVEALKNLVPQFSKMSQARGGPAITLDNILEPPKPAQAAFPNGQAASVYIAVTHTTSGVATHYRSRAQIETWLIGNGAWSMYLTELAAPDVSFDKDWPVMLAIAQSLKTDPQAVKRASDRALDAQKQNFAAMQRANATRQEAFDGYLKSQQRNSIIRSRSAMDFDEVIRGDRTVEDTRTGERRSVDLGNVDAIVDRLNASDPGRYVQIPLRDEMYPLPPEPNR